MATLEGITAAAKLRHEAAEVQRELEAKRVESHQRMAAVREEEEHLQRERQELQDTLVQYYKFIQENEIKKNRAMKKAAAEAKAKEEWQREIELLHAKLERATESKQELKLRFDRYVKYQRYLEEVLQFNDNDDFQDPRDVVKRWETLRNNTKVLQKRKNQLEEDLLRSKNQLNQKRQRHNNESVDLQNQLNELQTMYESLQKTLKIRQDELERCITQKRATTKTVSHLRMATQNLFSRCVKWNTPYRGCAKLDVNETDILVQLRIIDECVEDYQLIIKRHQELQRQQQQQLQQQQQPLPL